MVGFAGLHPTPRRSKDKFIPRRRIRNNINNALVNGMDWYNLLRTIDKGVIVSVIYALRDGDIFHSSEPKKYFCRDRRLGCPFAVRQNV